MISFITSLYNSDKYLPIFIERVEEVSKKLTQSQIKHEFIIISNNPTIKEREALKEIESNRNIPAQIITCARESLYATWNRGIREAKFSIITFWNVDDTRFFEGIIDGIGKINEGAEIVYFPFIYKRYVKIFNVKILVKRITIDPPKFDPATFIKGMHCGPFFMVAKKAFKKIGFFDQNFKIAGDFDWCVRATKAELVFCKSDIISGIFTNDGTTLSGSKDKLQKFENSRITDII